MPTSLCAFTNIISIYSFLDGRKMTQKYKKETQMTQNLKKIYYLCRVEYKTKKYE